MFSIGRLKQLFFYSFLIFLALFMATIALGSEPVVIKQTDKYGRTRQDLPGLVVKGDRIYRTDKYGRIRHDLPGYAVEGDRVYETDKYGRTRHDKPASEVIN